MSLAPINHPAGAFTVKDGLLGTVKGLFTQNKWVTARVVDVESAGRRRGVLHAAKDETMLKMNFDSL